MNIPITFLNCSDCPILVSIPQINSLTELICERCPLLQSIPQINSLTHLRCNDCPRLTSIPRLNNLLYLNCDGCLRLSLISGLDNLTELICRGCILLQAISDLPSLTYLNCNDCFLLSSLKELDNLIVLECNNCSSLRYLPSLNYLREISYENTSIEYIEEFNPNLINLPYFDFINKYFKENGDTLLMAWAYLGLTDKIRQYATVWPMIKPIMGYQAIIQAKNREGQTAYHYAALNCKLRSLIAMKNILDTIDKGLHGEMEKMPDNYGNTPDKLLLECDDKNDTDTTSNDYKQGPKKYTKKRINNDITSSGITFRDEDELIPPQYRADFLMKMNLS